MDTIFGRSFYASLMEPYSNIRSVLKCERKFTQDFFCDMVCGRWSVYPGGPSFRVFRAGHPVKIDCRTELKDYLEGKRRNPLAVQFFVRGHWRNQACGPRHKDRRFVWIEPFWKGPEDALINLREHHLKKKPD